MDRNKIAESLYPLMVRKVLDVNATAALNEDKLFEKAAELAFRAADAVIKVSKYNTEG